MTQLTDRQKRYLRSLGHHLEPAVMIGANGVTGGVIRQLDEGLAVHELIKVRLGQGCGVDRKVAAEALASETGSAVAQVLGRTILFFRATKKRVIQLP